MPEAPAEVPSPSLAGLETSMPIWPGGAPPAHLDRCGMPYHQVQELMHSIVYAAIIDCHQC